MFIIGQTLVSEELFTEQFVCDLSRCKGACCVEGESGAPLEPEEIDELEQAVPEVRSLMTEEGLRAIDQHGLFTMDEDGDLVTTLVSHHGACAYVIYDEHGTAGCALERAFLDGKTTWRKPISCHLYPVRLARVGEYIAVNYHRWGICAPACECGTRLKVPVFRFLKEALIRRFGQTWYTELEEVYTAWAQG